MESGTLFIVLIDTAGFLASLLSIFIVAESTAILVPALRKGILGLMWGLGMLAASFFWKVVDDISPFYYSAFYDRILIVAGIVLLMFATYRLFRIRRMAASAA